MRSAALRVAHMSHRQTVKAINVGNLSSNKMQSPGTAFIKELFILRAISKVAGFPAIFFLRDERRHMLVVTVV